MLYLFTKSITEKKAELVYTDKIVNQIDINLIDIEQVKKATKKREIIHKFMEKVHPKVLPYEANTKKRNRRTDDAYLTTKKK